MCTKSQFKMRDICVVHVETQINMNCKLILTSLILW